MLRLSLSPSFLSFRFPSAAREGESLREASSSSARTDAARRPATLLLDIGIERLDEGGDGGSEGRENREREGMEEMIREGDNRGRIWKAMARARELFVV